MLDSTDKDKKQMPGNESAEDFYNIGKDHIKLEEYDKAIENFDKAIKKNKEYIQAYHGKGSVLFYLGKYLEIIPCYDEMINISQQLKGLTSNSDEVKRINLELIKVWSNKGFILDKLCRYEEAIDCYKEALNIDQRDPHAWCNKGVTLLNLDKYEEAISCFDKVINGINIDKKDACRLCGEPLHYKGVALDNLGDHEEAITCYNQAITLWNKAIEKNAKDVNAWYYKGFAFYCLGRHEEAISCYSRAIEINPQHQYAAAWANKGVALYELGMYTEAITCYKKATEINSHDAKAWYNKGIVLSKTGNVEKASKAFYKAREIRLEESKYWICWIASLYEDGKLDKCLDICDKGITYFKRKDERLKNNALKNLFYQKGGILKKQGKLDDALNAFRAALKFGNKQAQQEINKLIEEQAGWWEWWFSDIQTETSFLNLSYKYLFTLFLIILHVSCLLFYYYHPPIKTILGITLSFPCSLSLLMLLLMNRKALLGVTLIEILIAMLIIPLTASFSKEILEVTIENFSKFWKIWVACMVVIIFVLFHRNFKRIRTPWVEIEIPEPKSAPEFSMLLPK